MTTVDLRIGIDHLASLTEALAGVRDELHRLERWADLLADVLVGGGRLLTVGNGGSAAQAQHLSSELVGRYRQDRRPFSAIALHAETSALTAIANDYGAEEIFSRQVQAHGRPGDVLIALSTSGQSGNVLAAVHAARSTAMHTLAFTGRRPNSLAAACDDSVAVDTPSTATVQEVHLVGVHLLCELFDERVCR